MVLRARPKKVEPEIIKKTVEYDAEQLLIKEKQEGFKKELAEHIEESKIDDFLQYIKDQYEKSTRNDFWCSMYEGITEKQYLSDRQIQAVLRNFKTKDITPMDFLKEALTDEYEPEAVYEYLKSSNDYFIASMYETLEQRHSLSEKQLEAVLKNIEFDKRIAERDAKKAEEEKIKNMKPEDFPEVDLTKEPLYKGVEIVIPATIARKHTIPKRLKGNIYTEAYKHYYFVGNAVAGASTECFRCGKALTHPISFKIGYGPTCCSKLGIPWVLTDEEIEETIQEQIRLIEELKFSGWLPIKKVTIQ